MRAKASASALSTLLLLAICFQGPAQAEPPRTPALDAATERFESGKRLFREAAKEHNPAKVERAYFEFKAAYAIYPGRGALLNLVETELATHRDLDAMKHIHEYVRSYGVPEEHSEYRRTFDTQSAAAFKVTGHIEIAGPPSLRVVLDGKDEALLTPLAEPLDVAAGHHVVELVGGTETMKAEADAVAGAVTRVAFAVVQAPPVAVAPPVAPAPVDASQATAPVALPLDMPPPRAPSFWTPARVSGAAIGVAGLASLGAGFAFAMRANQDADHASSALALVGPSGCVQSQPQPCSDLRSAHDDQSRDHALNLVFVSVGAVAVAAGAVLVLWPTHASHSAALVPTISPQGGGLQLQGPL